MNVAKRIYLDNAATTHLDADVFEIMTPYFIETFGNANSQHFFGRQAETAVVQARTKLAEIINAKPNEIYFTSGGTEADNWAVKGVAYSAGGRGRHIITSAVEHHAVYDTCKSLEKGGFEITYIPVDDEGIIDLAALENAVRDDTILVSIMYANNEIGTIMPIKRAVETVKKRNRRTVFHTDCVQAAGALPLDVAELGVDLMSVSAHKFYGPKGTGFLYIKNGVKIDRLMTGGNQERKMRGGTLNVPHIVGCAAALEKATRDRERNNAHIKSLRDYFIDRVSSEIADVYLNGSREHRLPGNANFSFEFIEGESLLISLDLEGIAVSSGSACSSGSLDPSHVLLALGVPIGLAHGSLRFSIGKDNTKEEIDYTVDALKRSVERLRLMSPLFKQIKSPKYNV